jgi:hypothetical protein
MARAGRRCAAILAALATAAMLCAPAAPADLSSSEIIGQLSAQREANGIPGGLVENTEWSAGCAKHNYYGAQTGELRHSEDPGSPFYSEAGDFAAENSVLAFGSSWSQGNPWEQAPIHLIQMLAPQLSQLGAAENDNHNCATTWPGYERPDPDSLTAFSYPGDGVSGVVPAERAAESPFVPGDFVGLPEGTTTGRYLMAFLSGVEPVDASDVTAKATLSNGAGPVELRVIDSTSPDIGGYMPQPSAFLIPVQPLEPFTRYQAEVVWAMEGKELFRQQFAFTTGTGSDRAPTGVKKKRGSCDHYARAALLLRHRATRLRARGTALLGRASSQSQRRRGRRLLSRSRRLQHHARHRGKQARRCRAADLRSS